MMCLRRELQIGNLEEKILIENLKNELYSNLLTLLPYKHNEEITWMFPHKSCYILKNEIKNFDSQEFRIRNYNIAQGEHFYIYMIVQPHPELRTTVIEQILENGLWYDFTSGEPKETNPLIVLHRLMKSLEVLIRGADKEYSAHFIRYEQESGDRNLIQGYDLLHFIPSLEAYWLTLKYTILILRHIEIGATISIKELDKFESDFRFFPEARERVKQQVPSITDLKDFVLGKGACKNV